MSQFKSIERLSLILNFVQVRKNPTLGQIMEHLENHDVQPTERTLQRDFKTLRDLCFIEIKYNRLYKGYEIASESQRDLEDWLQVFEIFHVAKTINEALLKSPTNIDYIDFDRTTQKIEPGLFNELVKAITDKKQIQFIHQNFWSTKPTKITMNPLLMKQYQNRWYVFGELPSGETRIFGLERISSLSIKGKTFTSRLKSPKSVFDEVIGLVYSISEPEEIILSYSPHQGKYIKTLPLHASQQIIIDNEAELRIKINVRPNYELEERILKEGEQVKVIEPAWLRDKIRNRLKEALDQY